ncbi:MAG TPA: glycine cleavage system protein GcvH [Nocardioidaceae bacterium]|jgi:glycine cleavage system H protein|nr:glycine cleavage system protein GcvH [Nocardioidaceae bacterium]
MIPPDLRYTNEHEWLRAPAEDDGEEPVVTVGVTDYAQEQLGDIVYVSLPEPGDTIAPGTSIGELESTKSVSDLYAPVEGVVVSRNEALADTPELINSDPYGDGWLVTVRVTGSLADAGLLDSEAYAKLVG